MLSRCCLTCILVGHSTYGMLTCVFSAGHITSWSAKCAWYRTTCDCKSTHNSCCNVFSLTMTSIFLVNLYETLYTGVSCLADRPCHMRSEQ
uniref:Secreted protein n=1 Tax=Rhipicephalus appendiculatus TaxID=34631 RepID=A0A131YDS9_RHIAP